MKKNLMNRYTFFLILFIVLPLSGCQQAADTRAEFCDTLHEVGTLATEFKEAKVDVPVEEFHVKLEALQTKKKNLDRLAKLTPVPVLDKLAAAVDKVAEAIGSLSGSTVGPAVDTVQNAGAELESTYLELDEAVCAAK